MKIVLSSDWHGDVVTMGVPRYDEIEAAAMQSAAKAKEENADLYVFTGDLTDPNAGRGAFRSIALAVRVATMLREWRIPSIWLTGNHDVFEDGSGESVLSIFRELALFDTSIQLFDRPGHTFICRQTKHAIPVVALPFTASSHAYDATEELRTNLAAVAPFMEKVGAKKCLVLSHLTVPGIQPGEETIDMPRGREVLFPVDEIRNRADVLVLLGHYHRRQTVAIGDATMTIPGSLARLTFGEERNAPGFLYIADEGDSW